MFFYPSHFSDDPDFARPFNLSTQLYPHMFVEDVTLDVYPPESREKKRIDLVPESRGVERMVAESLRHNEWYGDLDSALRNFFGNCVETILSFGESFYELAYLSKLGADKPTAFEIVPIAPGSLRRGSKAFVQRIPVKLAAESNLPREIAIPAANILRFVAPPPLGDNVGLFMKELAEARLFEMPHPKASSIHGDTPNGYDFQEAVKLEKSAIAQITKKLGWNARGLFDDSMTEHYQLARRLRFERFCIQFRECILAQLNEGLNRAGHRIGFEAQIVLQGLPTIDDVAQSEAALREGAKSFHEIMAPFVGI
ncbi:MAG: hypothetical protein P9L99_18550 [Candidatus Lernaella stagnicola]|nr:hypothetical protein [Candidatus Lernaella stagnicola]